MRNTRRIPGSPYSHRERGRSAPHFDLEAGDASLMLNEFSRQSDMQVLFDFNILRGMKTRAVTGDLDVSNALKAMLKGTNLDLRLRQRPYAGRDAEEAVNVFAAVASSGGDTRSMADYDDVGLEQVLISGADRQRHQAAVGYAEVNFGRIDIERSGLATTEDFLRTLPQVFGGGPTEDTVLGREAGTNSAHGSGINIRGLDAGATLVLIDGKRIAPSGTAGAFDDISNIPLSIVDHIDILPDGASAKYGADAIGGVVNFVTRKNFIGRVHPGARRQRDQR